MWHCPLSLVTHVLHVLVSHSTNYECPMIIWSWVTMASIRPPWRHVITTESSISQKGWIHSFQPPQGASTWFTLCIDTLIWRKTVSAGLYDDCLFQGTFFLEECCISDLTPSLLQIAGKQDKSIFKPSLSCIFDTNSVQTCVVQMGENSVTQSKKHDYFTAQSHCSNDPVQN